MRKFFGFLTVLILLSLAAQASEPSAESCASPMAPPLRAWGTARTQLARSLCEKNKEQLQCEAIFQAQPELRQYEKKCTDNTLLNDVKDTASILMGCGLGGIDMGLDFISLIYKIPVWMYAEYQADAQRQAREVQFYDACVKSQECKELFWQAATRRDLTPSMKAKLAQLDNGNYLQSIVHQEARVEELKFSDQVRKQVMALPQGPNRDQEIDKLIPGWLERRKRASQDIMPILSALAKKEFNKFACYDGQTQAHMVCYGLAGFFGPTAVAKFFSRHPHIKKIKAMDEKPNVLAVLDSTRVPGKKGVDAIESVVHAPLPPGYIERLKSTPWFQNISRSYNEGEGLTFQFHTASREFRRGGVASAELESLRGEAIQTVFASKILSELFPKAKFTYRGATPDKGATPIKLQIADSAEMGEKLGFRNAVFEMSHLKMANPGPAPLARDTVRELLGLPQDAKIVALNNSYYNEVQEIASLVKNVKSGGADIIFVNQGRATVELVRLADHLKKAVPSMDVIYISQLGGQTLPKGKYIIINDMTGKMHAVYGASDVAVAAGAVNFAEPLAAGRPLLYMDEGAGFMHGYDSQVFHSMARTADKTGGARAVQNELYLPAELKKAFERPSGPSVAPHLIQDASGHSAVDRLSRHMADKLDDAIWNSEMMPKLVHNPHFMQRYTNSNLRTLETMAKYDLQNGLRTLDIQVKKHQIHSDALKHMTVTQKQQIEVLADQVRQNLMNYIKRYPHNTDAIELLKMFDMNHNLSQVTKGYSILTPRVSDFLDDILNQTKAPPLPFRPSEALQSKYPDWAEKY